MLSRIERQRRTTLARAASPVLQGYEAVSRRGQAVLSRVDILQGIVPTSIGDGAVAGPILRAHSLERDLCFPHRLTGLRTQYLTWPAMVHLSSGFVGWGFLACGSEPRG